VQVNKQLLLQRHNRGMNNRTRLVWNKDIIECIVLRAKKKKKKKTSGMYLVVLCVDYHC
jgi:hypothetical protein